MQFKIATQQREQPRNEQKSSVVTKNPLQLCYFYTFYRTLSSWKLAVNFFGYQLIKENYS